MSRNENRPNTSPWLVGIAIAAMGSFLYLWSGCAQNSDSQIKELLRAVAETRSPASNDTVASQGARVNVTVTNDNEPGAEGGDGAVCRSQPVAVELACDGSGNRAGCLSGALKAQHVTLNISTGSAGISPNATATSAANGGPITANPNSTVTPVQDVKPRVGVDVPVAFAPAGQANATGNANAGESGGDTTSTTDQKLTRLQGEIDKLAALLKAVAASQPVDAATNGTQ